MANTKNSNDQGSSASAVLAGSRRTSTNVSSRASTTDHHCLINKSLVSVGMLSVLLILMLTPKQMAKLAGLGCQIKFIMRIGTSLQGLALTNAYAKSLYRPDFARVIGHQPQAAHAQVLQHRLANRIITQICSKAQLLVGFNSVGTCILQLVGTNFVQQPDTTPLLTQIQQNTPAFGGDGLQCGLQLG